MTEQQTASPAAPAAGTNGAAPAPGPGAGLPAFGVPVSDRVMGVIGILFGLGLIAIGADLILGGQLFGGRDATE